MLAVGHADSELCSAMKRALAVLARALVTWADAGLSALALGCFFLPWHVVHEVRGGFFESGPARETGVVWICTGLSHYDGSFVVPALLAACLLVRGFTRVSRPSWALFVQLGLGVAIVVYAIQVELLKHLFQRVETRLAEDAFTFALLALLLSAASSLAYRALLFARRFSRSGQSRSDD